MREQLVLFETTKRCTGCKKVKGFEEFHQNKRNKDGLVPRCKECIAIYQKQRDKCKPYLNRLKSESLALENKKECTGCEKILPFSDFTTNGKGRNGLKHRCKSCVNEYHIMCMKIPGYRAARNKTTSIWNKANILRTKEKRKESEHRISTYLFIVKTEFKYFLGKMGKTSNIKYREKNMPQYFGSYGYNKITGEDIIIAALIPYDLESLFQQRFAEDRHAGTEIYTLSSNMEDFIIEQRLNLK